MLQIKGSKADCPIVLVGNKRDEEAGAREVPYTTGETLQVNTRAANHLREVSRSQRRPPKYYHLLVENAY